jgi:hypothetical protein
VSTPALINQRNNSEACESFLLRVLPRSGNYNVSKLDAQKKFRAQYANSVRDAVAKALEVDEAGNDAFFAMASYRESGSRKADNVLWIKSFWVDIDCGEEKAADGKGYRTKADAIRALKAFCLSCGLPIPTIVDSGGGLHCYWILNQDISAAEWLPLASKLKQVMALGAVTLLADPSRTADIASVLRPPGTHNRKPKNNNAIVKVLRESADVDIADFSAKINAAHTKPSPALQQSGDLSKGLENLPPPLETEEEIEWVKSMLVVLSPAMDRATWLKVLFALASTGWACAETLAREWSKKSDKYDEADFDIAWGSYRPDGGIGFWTLRYLAKEAGWEDPRASSKDAATAKVNERYALIESEAGIFDIQQSRYVSERGFHLLNANKKVNIGTAEKPNRISLSRYWLEHKDRRQHTELTLAPGQPQITASNQLNVWAGFSVPSIQGDVSLFLTLAEQLMPDVADRKFAMTWLASLIQNPAEKFHVALVVWSVTQGTGKNLFFESVGRIFPERHFRVIGQEVFADPFTEWLSCQLFTVADEVSAAGDRKTADRIKGWLTATKNSINIKNAPKYEEPNLNKYVFLSNHPDAVHLQDADRRFYVIEASRKALPAEFADSYAKWRDNGGLSAIRHYLESYNTSQFNPKAPAPMSRAKIEMIEDNRSDLERWLNTILNATNIAALLGREICTADELAAKYKTASSNSASSKAISNALIRAGVRRVTKQARCENGKRLRVYALCNPECWGSKTEIELGTEMGKPFIHFGG